MDVKKCGNEPCNCSVGVDDAAYCSAECEAMANGDITTLECECGHSGCGL